MQLFGENFQALRVNLLSRFFRDSAPIRKLRSTPAKLMSECGALARSHSDPVSALRDFHERNLLRIVDLYKTDLDPIETAFQLADLRKTLGIWAFRLASREFTGDYALYFGGSTVTGVHTFLTDFDVVVVPHGEKDREAAKNVHHLMTRILEDINIETDWIMPARFRSFLFEDLNAQNSWQLNDSAYRFLMDMQIQEVRGDIGLEIFRQKISKIREDLIYSNPGPMLQICKTAFDKAIDPENTAHRPLNLKNDILRLLHYTLYASRAKLGIRSSSFWEVLSSLQDEGILSAEEKEQLVSVLRSTLALRHLIGVAIHDSEDSVTLTDEIAEKLVRQLKLEGKVELLDEIHDFRQTLIGICQRIFERL